MPYPILHPKIDTAGPALTMLSAVVVNPLINTIMVDTGPLPAGDYEFWVWSKKATSGSVLNANIEKRDAANAVTQNIAPLVGYIASDPVFVGRTTFAANERMRVRIAFGLAAQTVTVAMGYRRVG